MKKRYPLVLLLALGLLAARAGAAEYYLTVSGSGAKTGADWANAYALSSLATVVNTVMQPGDTMYLGGAESATAAIYGDYRLTINSGGTAGAPKSLIGVDRGFGIPKFLGAQTTRSYTTITLADGVGYWTVKNLYIEKRDIGIATSGTAHPGLVIDGITVRNVRSKAYSFTDCDNLLVQNCRAERYSQLAFMWNSACDGVTVRNCVADCTGMGDVEDAAWWIGCSDPVGFNFHIKNSTAAFNTNVLLEDCETLNNNEDTGESYEQGDGFKMEQSNNGVTLRRCRSHKNRDAAYDLKGDNQVLEDCIAVNNSRYGFKIWYDGLLNNCVSVDNGARQMTIAALSAGHAITAEHCTFHSETNTQAGVVIETAGNTLSMNNCIISFGGAAGTYTGGPGTITMNNSVKLANALNTANPPRYMNPVLPWDGLGENFDNQTYGLAKGYNSSGVSQTGELPEAEDLIRTDSGAGASVSADTGASGGALVLLPAAATGDWVEFTAANVPAGNYLIKVLDKTGSDKGQYQMSIEGDLVGAMVDQFAATPAYREVELDEVTFTETGDWTFRFTVAGKNASSTGYGLAIDAIILEPITSVVSEFDAEADTYVWDGSAATNYGSGTGLAVKNGDAGFDRISYLRFPASVVGNILSATLKVKVVGIGSEGAGSRTIEIRQLASGDTWGEMDTTWNNRPSSTGALIATINAGTVNQVYSIDVTAYVTQERASDGKASFVLVQPSGVNKYVTFGSRENTGNSPVLEIVHE